jgi:hypothetical protein
MLFGSLVTRPGSRDLPVLRGTTCLLNDLGAYEMEQSVVNVVVNAPDFNLIIRLEGGPNRQPVLESIVRGFREVGSCQESSGEMAEKSIPSGDRDKNHSTF